MKKIYYVFFLLLLVIGLAACGDNSSSNGSDNGGSSDSGNDIPSDYTQGVTDDEILIGITGPQTGPVAEYDKVRKGVQAYFNYINENGGVKGRQLKLIAYDDQYQPAETVKGLQRLIEEDEVFALVYPIGTAHIGASFEMLKESGIPLVGLGTGATEFVDPPVRNIFGMQFNYRIEAQIFVDYMKNVLGVENLTVVYQNDDFGLESLEGAKEAVEATDGIEIVAEVSFLASDQDLSSQAQQIINSDPDAILMLSTPNPSALLRQELHKLGHSDIPYLTGITAGQDKNQFNVAGPDVWEGVITALPIESYEHLDSEDAQIYIDQITKEYGEDHLGALTQVAWGYAQVLVEGIERIEGDLTWNNLIEALETLEKYNDSFFYNVTYTPDIRYGNTSLYMVEAKDGEYVPLQGPIYYDPETGEINYE